MGNRRAPEFMFARAKQEALRRMQTEPRGSADDVAVGLGRRRIQLLVCPSFEDDQAWEIRGGDQEWELFRSTVICSWPKIQLMGYESVPFPSGALAGFYQRIMALSLPLEPYLNRMLGCDGTITQLAVFGDMWSEWRFQWWSDSPPHWHPLVAIVDDMLSAFATAGS